MSDFDNSSKTEQPTGYKLEKLRREGEVAKSLEWNSFIGFCAVVLFCIAFANRSLENLMSVSSRVFQDVNRITFDSHHVLLSLQSYFQQILLIVLPLFLLLCVSLVLSHFLQSGIVLTTEPLRPQLQRLNPITGLKKIFNAQIVFQLLKTIVKLFLFLIVSYYTIKNHLNEVLAAQLHEQQDFPVMILQLIIIVMIKLLVVSFFIAILDLVYMRWTFIRKHRMSRHELKEEFKTKEGDPLIRSKRKQLHQSFVKQSTSVQRVFKADVIISEGRHKAVALRFVREETNAPVLLASGQGELAEAIINEANAQQIPIYDSSQLANDLHDQVQIGDQIPERFYVSCARILHWAYQQQGAK